MKRRRLFDLAAVIGFGLLVAFLLAGCAGGKPYLEVGVGYQLDDQSDWYVRTTREWQCSDNWQAHFEAGIDFGRTRIGYHHQSWWTCGGPFWDDKPELYSDDIRITHTFGGKP